MVTYYGNNVFNSFLLMTVYNTIDHNLIIKQNNVDPPL